VGLSVWVTMVGHNRHVKVGYRNLDLML